MRNLIALSFALFAFVGCETASVREDVGHDDSRIAREDGSVDERWDTGGDTGGDTGSDTGRDTGGTTGEDTSGGAPDTAVGPGYDPDDRDEVAFDDTTSTERRAETECTGDGSDLDTNSSVMDIDLCFCYTSCIAAFGPNPSSYQIDMCKVKCNIKLSGDTFDAGVRLGAPRGR